MQPSNIKTVRNDMRTLIREAQSLFREAASTTGERAEELRNRGIQMLDTAVERAQELQSVALVTGKEVAQTTDDYVKDNPWRAVTLSAGAGLLLGLLLTRRQP